MFKICRRCTIRYLLPLVAACTTLILYKLPNSDVPLHNSTTRNEMYFFFIWISFWLMCKHISLCGFLPFICLYLFLCIVPSICDCSVVTVIQVHSVVFLYRFLHNCLYLFTNLQTYYIRTLISCYSDSTSSHCL